PMRNGYLAKKTISGNKANYYWIVAGLYSAASFFQPIFLVNVAQALYMANEFTKERNAWNEGLVWFDAEADTQWKTAIGARSFTSTSSQMFRCECHDPNDPMNGYLTDDYIDCLDENCAPISAGFITTYHISNKPNDGVVLNESAMNLPGHTHEPVKVMGELKSDGSWSGSSHMQIRNDKGLRDNMTNLLEGDYGKFFEMDNK
ncbi:MAG: hypothetical protein KAG84_08140, partial [Bacteroidales bacterium]|nr:hypothetical protein [Bacteroidales bacterium]